MNEKLNLFSGPIRIESWYEDHEKCECDPPFLNGRPTSEFESHEKTCPLREILFEKVIRTQHSMDEVNHE